MLVETFAPAHGWTALQAMNSLTIGGGEGNRDEDLPETFTLAGTHLKRARSARDRRDFPWATISHKPTGSARERQKNFIAWGGYGGVRVFERIFTFPPVAIDAGLNTIPFGGSEDRRAET